jgi:GTP cyclohydrolase II
MQKQRKDHTPGLDKTLPITVPQMFDSWLDETSTRLRREIYPLVTLSYAQSLDGSIALQRGTPLPLSGVESTRMTHLLRASHNAILVGIGTIDSDDPLLTVRHAEGESPIPVILDSHLRTSEKARIFHNPKKPIIACLEDEANSTKAQVLAQAGATLLPVPGDMDGHISLLFLLKSLLQQGIESVMVEGGATIIAAFLRQGLVDRVVLTITPFYVGGLQALEDSISESSNPLLELKNAKMESIGKDFVIFGELENQKRFQN